MLAALATPALLAMLSVTTVDVTATTVAPGGTPVPETSMPNCTPAVLAKLRVAPPAAVTAFVFSPTLWPAVPWWWHVPAALNRKCPTVPLAAAATVAGKPDIATEPPAAAAKF
jgi:hypothetical protein